MSVPWSCPHFTFEDFNQLQDYISDSVYSLKEVVTKEFKEGAILSNYDPEKPIDHRGFCIFMSAYLGENFPQSVRDKLFLSFMRRHSCTKTASPVTGGALGASANSGVGTVGVGASCTTTPATNSAASCSVVSGSGCSATISNIGGVLPGSTVVGPSGVAPVASATGTTTTNGMDDNLVYHHHHHHHHHHNIPHHQHSRDSNMSSTNRARFHSLSAVCTNNLFFGLSEKLSSIGLGNVLSTPRSHQAPFFIHHNHGPCPQMQHGNGSGSGSKYRTLPIEPFFGVFQQKNKNKTNRLGGAQSHPSLIFQSIHLGSNNQNGTDDSPAIHSRSSSKKSGRSTHSLYSISNKKIDTDMNCLKQNAVIGYSTVGGSATGTGFGVSSVVTAAAATSPTAPTMSSTVNHNVCSGGASHSAGGAIPGVASSQSIKLTDTDKIDMKDLLCYLSLLESGRPEDKLEFMFRLYDSDGNGVLDKSEVESIICQMMNVAAYLNWDTEELLPILREMMHEIDYDNDGEVTLEEWKRGGMTNIPLLVLLGLDTNVRDDGKHVWNLKHFTKANHCGLCSKILVRFGRQGLCCIFCKFTVHERCVQKAPNSCISTYTKSRKAEQLMEHHWLENHYSSKCSKCKKSTKVNSKPGYHCRWCKRTIHKGCIDNFSQVCDLGEHREHILPPTSIFPSVLERKPTSRIKDPTEAEESNEEANKKIDYVPEDEIDSIKTSSGVDLTSMDTISAHENALSSGAQHQQQQQQLNTSGNQTSSFQIFPSPGTVPMLVFINPKSGGKQGARILEKFQYILNPRQVYDMVRDKGPHNGLQFFKDVPDFRILVCGGDGTVGWLLEAMDKYEWGVSRPSVSILPLGTGNDLARCLKWGGGYEGENLNKILSRISTSTVVLLDRWQITCSEPAPRPPRRESRASGNCGKSGCIGHCSRGGGGSTGSSVKTVKNAAQISSGVSVTESGGSVINTDGSSQNDSGIREDSQVDYFDDTVDCETELLPEVLIEANDEIPCNIINNYFSIGVDASIAHRFHTLREKHPEKFNSRMRNRIFYMEVGTYEMLTATCKHLNEYVDIICDGVALDLRRRGSLEGIAFLNIASVYGGKNLWGANISTGYKQKKNSTGGKLKKKKSDASRYDSRDSSRDSAFENLYSAVQDMGDSLLEVVGLENAMHAGLVAGGFRSSGIRLAQCREVVIRTQRCFPMQIDGEPWIQSACTISITYKNQVPMTMAPTTKKFGLKSMFSR